MRAHMRIIAKTKTNIEKHAVASRRIAIAIVLTPRSQEESSCGCLLDIDYLRSWRFSLSLRNSPREIYSSRDGTVVYQSPINRWVGKMNGEKQLRTSVVSYFANKSALMKYQINKVLCKYLI